MKSILIFTFVLATYLSVAQSNSPEIKRHYHIMDSLWNKDDYTGLISYCKANETFFKQNNTYPLYDYYRFLTEYLGEAYTENGEYDEAEKTFEASRAGIIKEIFGAKMHPAYWDVLQEMGYMYRVSGRFTKAYSVYTEAWKVAEFWRSLRWWKYIKLADNLINICTSIGKYDDAEYYAGKVEKSISQANYTKDQLLDHYIVLAVFYTQILAVQKAELYIQKASDLLPKTAFNIFTKVELNNVQAMALMASGRKDTAEKVLVELLGMLDKLKMKNTDSYYLATGNLASVFLVNSHTKEADSILNNTLSNPGKTKSKYFGALYLNLALVNAQGAAYEKALANIDSALMIFSAQAKDEAQFNLPAKILRSAFLLKLNRKEEAYVVYNNVMQWYINYIRENVVHLSESEKNSLLMSYFNMANFAASFLVAADGQVSNDIVRKIWEQQLFFNGLAAGEQTKLYSLLRQNKDTAIQNLFAEWRELRHFLYAESQKSAILQNRNLANIALLAEKKEKQLI